MWVVVTIWWAWSVPGCATGSFPTCISIEVDVCSDIIKEPVLADKGDSEKQQLTTNEEDNHSEYLPGLSWVCQLTALNK